MLKNIICENNLFDVADCSTSNTFQYTHFQNMSQARLDRIYTSDEFDFSPSRYTVTPVAFSDHSMVIFSWKLASCDWVPRRNDSPMDIN